MPFICDDDEIPRWNRDKLWKCNLIGNDDEIPIRERDELWRRNSFGEYGEIPMGRRQIFNIVGYSEASVESLVLGRENVSAK